MANVYVLGSLNMDTTYYVDRLPGEGETITSVSSQSAAGGKGLNQSAAAAWTGAATEIIGAVGKDGGQAMIDALQRQHVGMRYLQRSGCFPAYQGTEVTYFPSGEAKFQALLQELEQAKQQPKAQHRQREKVKTKDRGVEL